MEYKYTRKEKLLIEKYNKEKRDIKKRLNDFKKIYQSDNKRIFSELCFCILTPQSKAVNCDKAVKELYNSGLLLDGDREEVRSKLKGVRFPNNKASYILEVRDFLKNGNDEIIDLRGKIDSDDIFKTRDWLVKNIKGIGYKEASHFLRNIGLGDNIGILDRHILENFKKYNIIGDIPKYINKKKYIDIENKFRKFSRYIKISLSELDLLFWSSKTGYIFK